MPTAHGVGIDTLRSMPLQDNRRLTWSAEQQSHMQ